MNEKNNTGMIREIYGNFKSGDIAGLLDKIDDSAVWILPNMDNVPHAGARKGKNAIAEFFSLVGSNMEFNSFEPTIYYSNPEGVAVYGTYNWTVKETGRTATAPFAHFFTIRDGKVVYFREVTDTAVVAASFASVETAA